MVWFSDEQLPKNLHAAISELRSKNKKFVLSTVSLVEFGDSPAYLLAKENDILSKSFVFREVYNGFAYGKNVSYVDYGTNKEAVLRWLQQVWEPKLKEIDADAYFYLATWQPDQRDDIIKIPKFGQLPYIPEHMNTSMKMLPPWTLASPALDKLVLTYHNTLSSLTVDLLQNLHSSDANSWIISTNINPSQSVLSSVSSFKHIAEATWVEFRLNVDKHASLALAGINHFGSIVCGSHNFQSKQEELCIRWYQFASLTPLFKVNTIKYVDKFTVNAQRIMIDTIKR